MNRKHYLYSIIIILSIISCRITGYKKSEFPCNFNNDKLTITGSDVDFKDNINIKNDYVIASVKDLMGVHSSDGYRVDLSNHKRPDHFISYNIKHCRNMEWAKAQILNEIGKLYPYEIIDTIEISRIYDFTFLDTSYFVPTIYEDPEEIYFGVEGDRYISYNNQYPSFLMAMMISHTPENKGILTYIGNVEPPYIRYKNYDVSVKADILYSRISLDSLLTYLKDSMSVIVNLSEEKITPIKLIRLKK